MIFQGEQTPYRQATKNAPDRSVAALVTSDAVINQPIADYIALAAKQQSKLEVIRLVATTYAIEDSQKVQLIRGMFQEAE